MICPCLLAVANGFICEVVAHTSLQGTISGRGPMNSKSPCAWLINPGNQLLSIDFQSGPTDSSFAYGDVLALYTSADSSSQLVARFYDGNPIQPTMSLEGSNQAFFALYASSNQTHVNLAYNCRPYGMKFGSVYLPPSAYICVMAGIIAGSIIMCCIPLYCMYYCLALRSQARSLEQSQVIAGSQLMAQWARGQHEQENESTVLSSLNALPVLSWKNDRRCLQTLTPGTGGNMPQADVEAANVTETIEAEECSVCLEAFIDQDKIRVLPCRHYFHQACIDTWFRARVFLPRHCPLCKGNPVRMALQSEILASRQESGVENCPPTTETGEENQSAPPPEASDRAGEVAVEAANSAESRPTEVQVLGRPESAWMES